VQLLLATHNEHKRREFERLLAGRWQVRTLPEGVELPPEDGETFAENALGKARAAALATGRASFADDSGIAAAALGGAPGVRSARYAGEHASDAENLRKLLREVPAGGALEYVCAIAYVDPDGGVERVFEGRCAGRLAAEPRGEGGFGYDPAFVPDDVPPAARGVRAARGSRVDNVPPQDRGSSGDALAPAAGALTMAQLSDEQKDAISHRGRAARALLQWLESRTGSGFPTAG
jgi:XTP/dITP diphosphohydrolase